MSMARTRSAEAPILDAPPATLGAHDLMENGRDWCAFLLQDPRQGLLIWVGERDDIRQDFAESSCHPLQGSKLFKVSIFALTGTRMLLSCANAAQEHPGFHCFWFS